MWEWEVLKVLSLTWVSWKSIVCSISKGTYGEVFKTIKYLDNLVYAIKRIYFSVAEE